jgi:hypothetical protein
MVQHHLFSGGGFFSQKGGLCENAPEFNAAVFKYIRDHDVKHVVLGAFWGLYQRENRSLLDESLKLTIDLLHSVGTRTWVLQDIPYLEERGPRAMARAAIFGGGNSWRCLIGEHEQRNSVLYDLSKKNLPAVFIDPAPLFLDDESDRYRADADGVSLYHDDDHLTKTASVALLLPLFREAMMSELVKSGGR